MFETDSDTPATGSDDSALIDVVQLRALRALRRITRAIDIHSRRLSAEYGITGPQLIALLAIVEAGSLTAAELSRQIHVSASTLVGIVDRLERKRLIERSRDTQDRRRVNLIPTDDGKQFVLNTPSPIQRGLVDGLSALSDIEKAAILLALEKVVELMEARHIDAAPILESGPLSNDTT